MPLRMAITKVSGQGEQIVIDVSQLNWVTGETVHKDIEEMEVLFNQGMNLVDSRLLEMNMRMLEAYALRNYFEPDAWMKIVAIFDVLAGRQDITTVKQRWDDAVEENRELAEAREAAHSNGVSSVDKDDERCSICFEKSGYHSSGCSNFNLQFEGQ